MRELPAGTVTFLFTDIKGSTRLLHELGDAYADALAEHRRALREARAPIGQWEHERESCAEKVFGPGGSDVTASRADGRRLSLTKAVEYALS